MIVLTSNNLGGLVQRLGDSLNEYMRELGRVHAYTPDAGVLRELVRGLERLGGRPVATRGSPVISSRRGNVEVSIVATASGYRDVLGAVINYYTNVLMTLRQVVEYLGKLGVTGDYTIIIGDNGSNVIVGYTLPDMTGTPLLELPSIRTITSLESVLTRVSGLGSEELGAVARAIDSVLAGVRPMVVDRVVRLDGLEYPVEIRRIRELLGGGGVGRG